MFEFLRNARQQRMPDGAFRVLKSALRDTSQDVAAQAAEALGKLKDHRAIEPLTEIAVAPNVPAKVRSVAAGALHNLGSRHGTDCLRKMLEEADPDSRQMAASAVGHNKIEELTPIVVERLKDGDFYVRGCAAGALRDLGGPTAEAALLKAALADPAELGGWLREAAVAWKWKRAILQFVEASKGSGSTELSDWAAPLAAFGEPALLVGMLGDDDERVRCSSAGELAKCGDFQGLAIALQGAESSSGWVRKDAAEALGYFKGQGSAVLNALCKLLRDQDHMIRYEAVLSLGRLKDPRAIVPLMAALKDAAELVSSNAARSLGEIGDASIWSELIQVKDYGPMAWLTCGAIDAAVAFHDTRVVPFLIKTLDHREYYIRGEAAKALMKLKERSAIPALKARLDDPNVSARCSIAEAFAALSFE